ncbi:hypothetical protein Y1Q_0005214 [Alligator mississippiensis]|uniref:Uncharacterized protein n=1 Tax=Alligator mississippiensis TaxID=8496 RepID=A0A151MT30_ALLMI|nr:hypothetical protein Y1Q_0005214 [Alligator mississippiensis]
MMDFILLLSTKMQSPLASDALRNADFFEGNNHTVLSLHEWSFLFPLADDITSQPQLYKGMAYDQREFPSPFWLRHGPCCSLEATLSMTENTKYLSSYFRTSLK